MFKAFAFGIPLGARDCGDSRARWGWNFDAFGPDFWGGRGRQHRGRMGRVFEQGDLKYVILRLLEEKPRHGYEIIKELEDKFGGAYSPSPGTVYPTLTMLEDLGYARATPEEGGRRIYEITDAGRAHLTEHQGTVGDSFERIRPLGASLFGHALLDVTRAMGDVARAVSVNAPRHAGDPERLRRVREVLQRAAKELQDIGAEPPATK